ncbi:MAG: nuclear transport factor 2 family protein [Acidimicrobiia bacterium]|nr:nuclear transport factor 2 family protein [Acidimicrobiia bacterium]
MVDDDRRSWREALVREHMRAENEQRWDDVMTTLSSPRYELVASGQVFDGDAQVREYWLRGRELVPDQRNELIALHHGDDSVIAEFWLRGTHRGGPDATGHTFEARMVAVFEFDDTGIVCERVYWDRQTINEQLLGGA